MKKVVVITGASSGIGLCTAVLFADNGYTVYSLSRSRPAENRIIHIHTDISDEESVKSAIDTVISAEGRISVLVNNAGYGISGAVETTDVNDAKRLFEVNFFGTFTCIKYVLPHMRAAGGGCIVNVSSVAAVLPLPYQAFYSCTKSALNSLTLALANEVRPFGIRVSAVMPGDVRSGFTAARKKSVTSETVYSESQDRAVSRMEKDEQGGMQPEIIARQIYRAALKKRPKVLYTAGLTYKLFILLAKVLPAGLVNRIEGKIYS
ncbi:MAG: short-chain dehydrogenase [Firmicutes bacterium HGW-Firmicutes-21]|nr:MAG: short-chain dehydrogenase [Firmicutes bacterium HGW-Firmicutes-21]